MNETRQIRCKNNKKTLKVDIGTPLYEVFQLLNLKIDHGPMCAMVNNKIEGLNYRIYHNVDVEFLDIRHPSARRTYTRTLFFILCKAVYDIYGKEASVVIDIPVSNGYYCDLKLDRPVTADDVSLLRQRMQEIIDSHITIHRHEKPTDEVIRMFTELGALSKVTLLKTVGTLYTTYYEIDGYNDYFYGAMLDNTSKIYLFGLEPYYDGMLLRLPSVDDPTQLGAVTRQDKMFEIFREHHRKQQLLGIGTVGRFNQAIEQGHATDIINVSEAFQEKSIARIADQIADRPGVRMVLIAGPSSSGKTTTCKRLSVHLYTHGIRPVQVSLDDYFVDREKTPRDATGDYDYESIYALNLPLINQQFNALFRGEAVELPRYDFQTGTSQPSGNTLQLGARDILVVEGIHALNPELTAHIDDSLKFRVYASALTTILLDTHNYIPTTDNRLLRRIIRDYKYRGCKAEDTLRRWPSVRRGENKWIFPYQENADAMLNTAMIYELAVIKTQAMPALEEVKENSPQYAEAYRLMKFLNYFKPLSYDILPPTSLLREFLGGSSFTY